MQLVLQLVLASLSGLAPARNQARSVVSEQLVSETLFQLLYILDTSNRVQQHITLSIQLCHHPSHFPVLARPAICISKLIVWAPTRCTRADRAQTVDSNHSTIHAERIQIYLAPANLKSICQYIPPY